MSNNLSATWSAIELLLEQGISLIPVWDSDRTLENGEVCLRKAACFSWKQYQQKRIIKEELWLQMERANTTAVAMVCGAVSGGMEVIDVDVKWKPGVEAQLFAAVQTILPSVYEKLRIHRTPSGGYHIPYKVASVPGEFPGNQKLAEREKTEEELRKQPKPKTVCFIETRAEGGYVVAPPSLGYSVERDREFPTLTWEERSALITICSSFNELVKIAEKYTPTKKESAYYDETPFEHFNRTCDAVELLQRFGWRYIKQAGKYLWFSRPGAARATDVHASFNTEKRFFYIFSTNAEGLEADRAYLPSTVLTRLGHASDRNAAYASLVEQGFGRIKQHIEQKLVKQLAMRGKELPRNASAEAQTAFIETRANLEEKHPHGLFWSHDSSSAAEIKIDRERMYAVAEALGFRCWQNEVVRIENYTVSRCTEREFYDTMKEYIREEEYELYMQICNAYEAFIQKNGEFTQKRLALLEQNMLLNDTRNTCYKFYLNGFVEITAHRITLREYSELNEKLVWAEKIQQREYNERASTECLYTKFLARAIANDDEHIQQVIGYLAHEYKDETIGYIIVLTEECSDPKQGGGTGKNIFAALMKHTTTFKSIPGAMVKYDEKFLQAWNYERILAISDVPKKFEFEFLKDLTTGDGKQKKLFHDEHTISIELMPKFIVSTQFSYEVSDGGLRRRIIPLEFTDFFTKAGGVDVYFGVHFPRGWRRADWEGYDFFIAGCVQTWLRSSLKLSRPTLSEGGKQKQFEITYGQSLREFFAENFEEWCREGAVEKSKFREQYHRFCEENDIKREYQVSSIRMNAALQEYCEERGIEFEKEYQWSEGGIKFKGKAFIKPAPF